MRRIQSKKQKLGTFEIDKNIFAMFWRYVLDDGIYSLAYLHKDNVTDCNKKEEIKEDCHNWKRLW